MLSRSAAVSLNEASNPDYTYCIRLAGEHLRDVHFVSCPCQQESMWTEQLQPKTYDSADTPANT